MARVVKREAAKRDLIQRWVWYAENATLEVADRFLNAADDAIAAAAKHPESGQPVFSGRRDLQSMRRVPVGDGFEKTLLFYFPLSDGVDLVRVLHGNQDLDRIFGVEAAAN
jgi:toxin ParE1/3/4